MGIRTAIEYCDSTVNPIMGCTGCELYSSDSSKNHCYAATLVNRYAGKKGWPKQFSLPEHFSGRLKKAIAWSDLASKERSDKPWLNGYPRIIFVNDLSDGFCPSVSPEQWLAPHLKAMAESPHVWLLLTKWPKKMRLFCELHPLPENVWPGVSVLRRRDVWRVEELLQIQASMRWLSLEPLLEKIDLWPYLDPQHFEPIYYSRSNPTISLVICGGESGPGARPMNPQWVRDIRDQCLASGTPWFLKQWGAWLPFDQREAGQFRNSISKQYCDYAWYVGKKRAGHLLDGREWREFPNGG